MNKNESETDFELTANDLCEITKYRGLELVHYINERFTNGIRDLCSKLHTSIDDGIQGTPEDLALRRKVYGQNVIPPKPMKSFFMLMYEALQDITLVILIIAATISMGLSFYNPPPDEDTDEVEPEKESSWIEGVAILFAVVVVVLVTAINDWKKEKQFRGLKNKLNETHLVSLVRNGKLLEVAITELVVGDTCLVKYGDMLPADGIILQSNDLVVDESSLTGESDQVKKGVETDPILYSGTLIMEGSGKIMIVAVGLNSQAGIILSLLGRVEHEKLRRSQAVTKRHSTDLISLDALRESDRQRTSIVGSKEKSVLQAKLTRLAIRIGYIGTVVAIVTVLILAVRFSIKKFLVEKKPWNNKYIQF